MDNQSILICLPLIFIQNERLWGFKRTSENIGVLPARKHEYDNKRIFFSPHKGECISECIYSLK